MPTQSAAASPTSAASTVATASGTPEPGFSPTLVGETPGPDATIPPGQPILANLDLGSIVSTAGLVRMGCESSSGGFPGTSGGYTVSCTTIDPSGSAQYSLRAVILTTTGVVTLSADVTTPTFDGTITDPEIAPQLLLPVADLVAGSAAREWAASKMDDASCNNACTAEFGDARLVLTIGVDGSRSLDVTPTSMP
jgi:hypothetical protein